MKTKKRMKLIHQEVRRMHAHVTGAPDAEEAHVLRNAEDHSLATHFFEMGARKAEKEWRGQLEGRTLDPGTVADLADECWAEWCERRAKGEAVPEAEAA